MSRLSVSYVPPDLYDDVHCPLCADLYTEPQLLPCHHTLCRHCAEVWTKSGEVVCPVCKEASNKADIKPDFKVNRLIEKFLSTRNGAGTSSERHEPGDEKAVRKCNLCDERSPHLFCRGCQRYLCKTCQKTHVKLTQCKLSQAKKIEELVPELAKTLLRKVHDLTTETDNMTRSKDEAVEETKRISEQCLKQLEAEEQRTISDVKNWYSKQKDLLKRLRDENLKHNTEHFEDLIDRVKSLTEQINAAKRSTESLLAIHDSLQDEIDREVIKLKKESFFPLKLKMKNRGQRPFDAYMALTVEIDQGSLSEGMEYWSGTAEMDTFTGLLRLMKCLRVCKVAKLRGSVHQLQIVDGQLWALLQDQIIVLAQDGSTVTRLLPGLVSAQDMCVVGNYIIVADAVRGLLQLSTDGHLIHHQDGGHYLSVTSCDDHQSFWAVKQEGDKHSKLWICKYDATTIIQVDFEIEQTTGRGSATHPESAPESRMSPVQSDPVPGKQTSATHPTDEFVRRASTTQPTVDVVRRASATQPKTDHIRRISLSDLVQEHMKRVPIPPQESEADRRISEPETVEVPERRITDNDTLASVVEQENPPREKRVSRKPSRGSGQDRRVGKKQSAADNGVTKKRSIDGGESTNQSNNVPAPHTYTKSMLKQDVNLETSIESHGRPVYCAMLGRKLYLCSFAEHCIYAVDTFTGITLSAHGRHRSTGPGELNHPSTIYSDEMSHSLLVTDRGNHRLQVFDQLSNTWTVVNTVGDHLKLPEAAAADNHGNIWIGTDGNIFKPYSLYKCNLHSKDL